MEIQTVLGKTILSNMINSKLIHIFRKKYLSGLPLIQSEL